MIELALLYGIPLVFLGLSTQAYFFHSWRFLLSLSLGGYLALWSYPLVSGSFKDFFSGAIQPWRAVILQGSLILILFIVFFQVAGSLSSHSGNGYHLPGQKSIATWIIRLLSSFVFAALVCYLICLSPLHFRVTQSKMFSEKTVRNVLLLTNTIDKLSLQGRSSVERKKQLMSRLHPLEDPVKKAQEAAAKAAAEKAAAEKAAAEKAAAEKAAAAKARYQRNKKYRTGNKVQGAGSYTTGKTNAAPQTSAGSSN